MKSIKLLLVCFICFGNTYAQGAQNNGYTVVVEIIKKRDTLLTKIEITGFNESDSSWVKNVKTNISKSIQGDSKRIKKGIYVLSVKFIMSKDGYVADISCEKDPGFEICNDVIRVLKKSKNRYLFKEIK